MTWNLWWRFGDWRRRRDAILAVLRQVQPDLCGLQEVWSDGGDDLVAWLARELGMHHAFGAPSDQQRWRDRVGDPSVGFGVGVLSRWPIRDEKVYDLPGDASRPALSVMVDAPHGAIPFVTVHLSADVGASAVRVRQVEFLARTVADLEHTAHPPVVVGDFNAAPDSDEVRRFGGFLTAPVVPGLIFVDAWRYVDPSDPGYTWDNANPYVAAGFGPSTRLDYIHVANRRGDPGYVLAARREATGPVDGVWPSDHTAVVAELRTP